MPPTRSAMLCGVLVIALSSPLVAREPDRPETGQAHRGPLEIPAPGRPGGLPDDRTPVSEKPFAASSAQGAADVVQTYYALLAERRFASAWGLWWDGGRASGMSRDAFVERQSAYLEYRAQVGAPGRIEGAAGSLYVTVPISVAARPRRGRDLHFAGTVVLRRVNGISGSRPGQRLWRIARIDPDRTR